MGAIFVSALHPNSALARTLGGRTHQPARARGFAGAKRALACHCALGAAIQSGRTTAPAATEGATNTLPFSLARASGSEAGLTLAYNDGTETPTKAACARPRG